MFSERAIASFWRNVPVRAPDECWLWKGTLRRRFGYGRLYMDGRDVSAHVAAFVLTHGRAPVGCVRHRCDVPQCVNPSHLEEGSLADNVRDSVQRGRNARGASCHATKLSPADVLELRAWYAVGGWSKQSLAEAFNISRTQARDIIQRRWWRHV